MQKIPKKEKKNEKKEKFVNLHRKVMRHSHNVKHNDIKGNDRHFEILYNMHTNKTKINILIRKYLKKEQKSCEH